jgi:hypothetical protein
MVLFGAIRVRFFVPLQSTLSPVLLPQENGGIGTWLYRAAIQLLNSTHRIFAANLQYCPYILQTTFFIIQKNNTQI